MSGLKIGIAWQGNKGYGNDRARSIPLEHFKGLAEIPGVRLISLQKGLGLEQLREFDGAITKLEPALDSSESAFIDTAAVMPLLDLVVTSDTSIAHLAGALGVPTWVALPTSSDWRWLRHRTDTPWYPAMRLFRQPTRGDWTFVFEEISRAIVREFDLPERQIDRALGAAMTEVKKDPAYGATSVPNQLAAIEKAPDVIAAVQGA